MNDKFTWKEGDLRVVKTQEEARQVVAWNWTLFDEARPKIEVCVRKFRKVKTPVAVSAQYEIVERNSYKYVLVCFEWREEAYSLEVNQWEISACLNAPARYEPALNKLLAEKFYQITLKLA